MFSSLLLILAAVSTLAAEPSDSIEAQVTAERLKVFDAANESAYVVATLNQGDSVRVRPLDIPRPGWLAVEAPASAFCWVEESALDWNGTTHAARVRIQTIVRSGHPDARQVGPPCGELKAGQRVWLADRPTLETGTAGRSPRHWQAIAPPSGHIFFVAAEGVDWISADPSPDREPPTAIQTAFLASEDDPEMKRIDNMLLAETTGRPLETWRLESIRTAYETLLAQAGGDASRRDLIQNRLAQLSQYERASKAAREFLEVNSRFRDLDASFDKIERSLTAVAHERSRAFDAVGFVQSSDRRIDGRKLAALIGREGSVVAYLDVPPGINLQTLTTRRIGVRGSSRFDPELKARLITVRDMVDLETPRSGGSSGKTLVKQPPASP